MVSLELRLGTNIVSEALHCEIAKSMLSRLKQQNRIAE